MPTLYSFGKCRLFFWSNESGEPVHVHVAMGSPSPNTTKIWLTKASGCVVANNRSRIPDRELNQALKFITTEHAVICELWKKYFGTDDIKFYC